MIENEIGEVGEAAHLAEELLGVAELVKVADVLLDEFLAGRFTFCHSKPPADRLVKHRVYRRNRPGALHTGQGAWASRPTVRVRRSVRRCRSTSYQLYGMRYLISSEKTFAVSPSSRSIR